LPPYRCVSPPRLPAGNCAQRDAASPFEKERARPVQFHSKVKSSGRVRRDVPLPCVTLNLTAVRT
jgi:hypothetical protein